MDLIDCPLFSENPVFKNFNDFNCIVSVYRQTMGSNVRVCVYMFIKFVSLCNDLRNNLICYQIMLMTLDWL